MVVFLFGEDQFRSRRKLNEIKSKFLEKNKGGFGLKIFDFLEHEEDINEIVLSISSDNLFSSKRLAVVKNLLASKKGSSYLFSYLKNKPVSKNTTLVFWEGGSFEKKSKLYKLLLKTSKHQEFKFLQGSHLSSWIRKEFQLKSGGQVSINPAAAEKLAAYVGSDLFLMDREIEKLIAFNGKGEVDEKSVELLVRAKINTDIFRAIDALALRNKKEALRLLHGHLDSGDNALYLLSMYFYQFRNLLKIKPLVEKNVPQNEIAGRLRIHPYVIKKSCEQARNFSLERLKSLFKRLSEIDFRVKTGKVDMELALDEFIAKV